MSPEQTPSPHEQSVVASHFAEIPHTDAKVHAFQDIGAVATGVHERPGYVYIGSDGNQVLSAEQLNRTELVDDEDAQREVAFREQLLEDYDKYAEPIGQLAQMIEGHVGIDYKDQEEFYRTIPGFLGLGASSAAFRIETDEGPHVVRFMREGYNDTLDGYVRNMRKGSGFEYVEQLKGLSFEHGAIVSELMAGESAKHMTSEKLDAIPDRHLEQFFDLIDNIQEIGIKIDTSVGNLLYDEEKGFSLVDYSVPHEDGRDNEYDTHSLIKMITGYTIKSKTAPSEFVEDYHAAADQIDSCLPVVRRLKEAAMRRAAEPGKSDRVAEVVETEQKMIEEMNKRRDPVVIERDIALFRQKRLDSIGHYTRVLETVDDEGLRSDAAEKLAQLKDPPRAGQSIPTVFASDVV